MQLAFVTLPFQGPFLSIWVVNSVPARVYLTSIRSCIREVICDFNAYHLRVTFEFNPINLTANDIMKKTEISHKSEFNAFSGPETDMFLK